MVGTAIGPRLADPTSAPPRRVWRDWALVAVVVASWAPEVLLRDDLAWPAISIVVSIVLLGCVLFRRTQPLASTLAAFGVVAVVEIAAVIRPPTEGTPLLWSTAVLLLFPYALFRWAAMRQAALGMGFALGWVVLSHVMDGAPLGDLVAGFVFFAFSATLGVSVRYRASALRHQLDEARLREREQLARELHDSVAHHVSSIALQAQGGRAMVGSQPDRAAAALAAIEDAATRTLAEMRAMVGALREGDEPQLGPQPGVADVRRLARDDGGWPRIDVELLGDVDDVGPTVGATVYRLAQESVTNAIRHARQATRVDVRVVADDTDVRVTVRDDGEVVPASRATSGYGLTGMAERAALLGGTLAAGPVPGGGWAVEAVLPRMGSGT